MWGAQGSREQKTKPAPRKPQLKNGVHGTGQGEKETVQKEGEQQRSNGQRTSKKKAKVKGEDSGLAEEK